MEPLDQKLLNLLIVNNKNSELNELTHHLEKLLQNFLALNPISSFDIFLSITLMILLNDFESFDVVKSSDSIL